MLLVEAGEMDVHQRVRINCNLDDVYFALKDDPTVKAMRDYDANALWLSLLTCVLVSWKEEKTSDHF